jgi:hypothetical protein
VLACLLLRRRARSRRATATLAAPTRLVGARRRRDKVKKKWPRGVVFLRARGRLVGWEDGEGLRWKGRVVRAVGCASPRQARLGLARPGEPAGLRRHRGGAAGRAGCALAVELNLSGAGGRNGRGCQCHHHQVASIPRALYLLFQAAQRKEYVRTYVRTGRRPASPNLSTFAAIITGVGFGLRSGAPHERQYDAPYTYVRSHARTVPTLRWRHLHIDTKVPRYHLL